ncbi:hypothetical protein ACFL0P_00700 [Candidatus Omnitrophota bacterium]
MKIFLSFISIFWISIGTAFILFPKKSKTLYTDLMNPVVKTAFILPLLFGVLFLWAHPVSRLALFIKVLGIISLIKGLFILISPVNMLESTISYFLGCSEGCCRLYGVFVILLGVVVGWSVG